MQFDKFELAMIALVVGQVPQKKPADMKMAVTVLDSLDISAEETSKYAGRPMNEIMALSGEEPADVKLTADECKFVAKTMVTTAVANPQFGGNMLRLMIPLWEKLYPKWEELA